MIDKVGKTVSRVGKTKGSVNKLSPRTKIDEIVKLVDKVDPKKFNLINEVKANPLYKISNRDKRARAVLDEDKDKAKLTSKNNIVPGQLVLFKYLNPKNQEELEYYDASPCTIFFGMFNSKEGKRVLGFNIHYFPPQLRCNIMQQIYEMYRPVYRKYFETGVTRDLDAFDYSYLTDELSKHHLAFAVREYIPNLIGDTYIVPPKMWPVAMFTEGWFKKETRATIMAYFKGEAKAKHKLTTGGHDKGNKWKSTHKKKR